MKLVLFDLDNTLLAGDSDYEWGQFLIAKGAVDGPHYEAKNRAFYEDYKAGELDIYAFLAFALRPLATHTREQLDAWHAEYMATRIKPMITQAARDLVNKHLNEADLVAVITATNSFVTGPIAKEFGIPPYAQLWAAGFLLAVEHWENDWALPPESKDEAFVDEVLDPFYVLAAPLDELTSEERAVRREDHLALALWGAYELREFWLDRGQGPRH